MDGVDRRDESAGDRPYRRWGYVRASAAVAGAPKGARSLATAGGVGATVEVGRAGYQRILVALCSGSGGRRGRREGRAPAVEA